MAKFIIEYNIHLGDKVAFTEHGVTADGIPYDEVQLGYVQDISQLPDVFVEGFSNRNHKYTHWRKDIKYLDIICSEYTEAGKFTKLEFEKDENVEFVHKGDLGTKEFDELIYRKLETQQ